MSIQTDNGDLLKDGKLNSYRQIEVGVNSPETYFLIDSLSSNNLLQNLRKANIDLLK